MGSDKPKKRRFVIRVGDDYYLTKKGQLIYNMDQAIKSKDMKKIEGVRRMEKAYQDEYDSPHTWYPAVDFTEIDFDGVNTDES